MKRLVLALVAMTLVAAACALVACNGLLGIGVASVEVEDSGIDAGSSENCDHYCDLMIAACPWSGNFGAYLNRSVCKGMCVFDMSGKVSKSNDDTLGCRIFYAELAAKGDATQCNAAGFLGGGVCGTTPCNDFCGADSKYCNSSAIMSPAYGGGMTDESTCGTDCTTVDGGYPYIVKADAGDIAGMLKGNTLNCRTWHLNNAYSSVSEGSIHCAHTRLISWPCSNTM